MSNPSRREVLGCGVVFATAGSLMHPTLAAATPGEVEADIQPLLAELDRQRQAWIEGRFATEPSGPLVQAPDMTIFGPFGGDAGSGGPELRARQQRTNAMFRGGSGESQLVRAFAAGDLLVLVMIERNEVRFEGRSQPHAWILRTTQVFRKDGDRWVRLHRHADPLIDRRSLEATLALLEVP